MIASNLADRGVVVLTAPETNGSLVLSAEIRAEVAPLATHLEAALAEIVHVGRVELLDRVVVDSDIRLALIV